MRSSSRARAAFLLLYGALLAWQVDRWFFTPHGIVTTWADRHAGLTASAGSPRGLTQTFVMGADGLDGIWLRPVAGGRPSGDLVVDLSEVHDAGVTRRERVVIRAADALGASSLHVPLRAQRHSRGTSLRIDLRHLHVGDGPALMFATTREDHLPAGRFLADGVEQWGDLVFETSAGRATLPYWMHEILAPWPAWMRAWPTVVAVVVAFNAALAWACAIAVGLVRSSGASGEPLPSPGPDPRVAWRAGVVATSVVVGAGLAVAMWPTPADRRLDLIAALPDAAIATTWPTLHGGVSAGRLAAFGRIHDAIEVMPTTTIRWTIDVPPRAVLRTGALMRPDLWALPSDGMELFVGIEHAGGRTQAAALTLFPMGVIEHRRLFPLEIPLQPWAGQRVTIVFEATPERWGNAVNDVAVWTEPRIEWPRTPASAEARVVRVP